MLDGTAKLSNGDSVQVDPAAGTFPVPDGKTIKSKTAAETLPSGPYGPAQSGVRHGSPPHTSTILPPGRM